MKKAIHIGIIILFLIAICVAEQLLAQSYFDELNKKADYLQNIVTPAENVNTEEIETLTNELKNYWTDKENVLCTFVNHKEIEDIGVELSKMQSASKENEKSLFVESLNLIKFYLMSYQHIIGINFQNIF